MRVVIIGSGNVATLLGRKIFLARHTIAQVFSPHIEHARKLAAEFSTSAVSSVAALDRNAEIYVVAIPDDELYSIKNSLKLQHQLVVHTAGSVSIEVLKGVSTKYGVMYPLQSLRKEMNSVPEIPLLVDANNEDNRSTLYSFAHSISHNVRFAGDEQRLSLHLAAVIASNFTNHLYTLAQDFCYKESVDFKLLLPLINEVANRLVDQAPDNLQTGPAIRNDLVTIKKHLAILDTQPQLREFYEIFTESIRHYYKEKEV